MLDLAYVEDSKADVDMNVIKTGAGSLHRAPGNRGSAALRSRGTESSARSRRHRHPATHRAPKGSGRTVSGEGQRSKVKAGRASAPGHNQSRQGARDSVAAGGQLLLHLIALSDVPASRRTGRNRRDLPGKRAAEGALLLAAFGDADGGRGLRPRHRRARRRAGCRSARFLRPDASYPERFAAIFERLAQHPDRPRTARFVCALAVVDGERIVFETIGTVEGSIAAAPAGGRGFGYDPIFYYPPYGATLAEVGEDREACRSRIAARRFARWPSGYAVNSRRHPTSSLPIRPRTSDISRPEDHSSCRVATSSVARRAAHTRARRSSAKTRGALGFPVAE